MRRNIAMEIKTLTCIECPMGCTLEAGVEGGKAVYVKGNSCPRGRMYAENEVICPRRVVTSTVRAADGRMIPVKTSAPVKKSEMFEVMKKIAAVRPEGDVRLGQVLAESIAEGADLVASDDSAARS